MKYCYFFEERYLGMDTTGTRTVGNKTLQVYKGHL